MIGAAIEIAAYAIRAVSVKKPDDVGLYATSASLIVIAPVLVCASLYILIGRLIGSSLDTRERPGTGKESLIFEGRVWSIWVPRIFVASDILSFLTQASGSGLASSNNWAGSTKDAGIGVLIGGLVLQLVTFLLFLVIVICYDVRVAPTSSPRDEKGSGVRSVLTGMYISGFFITVSFPLKTAEQDSKITDRQLGASDLPSH